MWTPTTRTIALAALLLLPRPSSAADPSSGPRTSAIPPAGQAAPGPPSPSLQPPAPAIVQDEPATPPDAPAPRPPASAPRPAPTTPRMPGAPLPGSAPNKRTSVLRPDTPLQPSPPDATHATSITRTMTVTEDGAASITLSSAALNRLLFPDAVTSAYTATEALDVIIEGRAVIVSFRATHPADLMVITRGAQYLLRLIPETLPAQTLRLRAPKPESHVTSSYETQLADLIQAGYRRSPPEGFRTERPARPLPPPVPSPGTSPSSTAATGSPSRSTRSPTRGLSRTPLIPRSSPDSSRTRARSAASPSSCNRAPGDACWSSSTPTP